MKTDWRYAIATLFVMHGFAHLVGLESSWGVGAFAGQAAGPPMLSGVAFGGAVLTGFGLLWLAGCLACLIAAAAVAFKADWAVPAMAGAAGYSFLISAVWLPTAWIGLAVDAAILLALLARSARPAPRAPRATA